jgi:hypothetical protein
MKCIYSFGEIANFIFECLLPGPKLFQEAVEIMAHLRVYLGITSLSLEEILMLLVVWCILIVKNLWNQLFSKTFHDPCKHVFVVSRLFIEVWFDLASFTPGLNIQKEGEVRDAKHLSYLWGFPRIDFYNVNLVWAISFIHFIVDLVKVRHEYVAVLAIRREKFNN